MTSPAHPEKGTGAPESAEKAALVVTQPDKYQGLLETIALLDRVTEAMGEDRSGDWSGSGSQTGGKGDDDATQSARAKAIAHLPEPKKMQRQLQHHIKKEIKRLRRDVRRATVRAGKPGSAHTVNELSAKIRRLNNRRRQR